MTTDIRDANQTQDVLRTENVNIYYGNFLAVRDIWLNIARNRVTAFIGPSGCGKSTLLRCYNRLNDLIESFRLEGQVHYNNENLYAPHVDPVEVRRRIGMVFQKPNPFPKSIYDNVAFGPKLNGFKGNMDELVERALQQAALWDEVKDKLRQSGLSLSGGQQQRLCIARAIATQPDVILMDEPCSALDPISTLRVEDLIHELKEQYTIVIVTHNMQQASRVSDMTAFFNVQASEKGGRSGYLVEYDRTERIFQDPQQEDTKQYVSGKFG
ncbi:phosphate ABC transporter ATP-binding protein PstB [Aetokthonos hydrillicola Thurmond2011]|jgi:phosphate transport system ATP-binding protein|uniref:Phosphate ABC transporter ATP-binding protein PstB n=1 Tax=Aetokthonos hydrillicola Thurmond2011 TaxID=2712845 RepID=A0AAP5I920_9CYAN|nr:phosphate ABC transporter ATP-binding protein PstB [Aetokthonos hydrillicola]MBO3461394.1 phosphate ABC transporter ATP-binding protein [Aetokthonos hydrillicola CCALA 1050]MBW4586830.1 phosphate ABC transporter ATP-binding protein [Aetokthonos hydrillicola CCALA 1050]MDR9895812.1 phosphate ABC transporter ATP-binding protein PstB [Aetokthonos hydrillicola Thurmond2011]